MSSGQSYNQRDRDRMATFFETLEAAKNRTKKTIKMIKSNQRKTRTHTGNLKNYTFEKEKFQKHVTTLPAGSKVSWRVLAIKFNLKNKNGVDRSCKHMQIN